MFEWFENWKAEREEKRLFSEMWDEQNHSLGAQQNICVPYHRDVAYEIFKLTKRVAELEAKLK